MESVQVVLPCLNEAAALPTVLASIPSGYRVLVVDNGSVDATAEVAREFGAAVVSCPTRGYGAACHAGLQAATCDVVVLMDADGSLDGGQLPRVVDPVRDGRADLMIGSRRPVDHAAWPWWLRLANAELARELSIRTGQRIRDLGPMRAARRERLLSLGLQDRRSGYPAETVVAAADAGWWIGQVEVDYRPRIGRSKVTGTPMGAFRAVRDLRAVMAAR
ncbi:glycosyltransferase family 2 protein [Microlunatus sp. Gsoil 973]|uniref:glycosyltransferase family 2 protein n=1 Tax=Microlunatus sp. Gsoil 973 TaxID=2672569 RepID=UPI0012B4A905|nr:glycosyltransferase family 2 protein [Microlunatus sp. Gsoil 973]QGN34998.1 glycosyltransferase [Microlunatus sp. Gsoil 973]